MNTHWGKESDQRMNGDVYGGSGIDQTTISEAELMELVRLGMDGLKDVVRPDTGRIGEAFDSMMAAVKRRSCNRRQSADTAIERCFEAFAGRGKSEVTARKFAENLSVLSMQWSGNFSPEEYLALAQTLCDEDSRGIVTLQSFKFAAEVGCLALTSWSSTSSITASHDNVEKRRAEGDGNAEEVGTFGVEAQDFQEGINAGHQGRQGGEANEHSHLTFKLQRASSAARSDGQNVWKILDDIIANNVTEATTRDIGSAARGVDDSIIPRAATAARTSPQDDQGVISRITTAEARSASLSPEILRVFLERLHLRVLSSPPLPLPETPATATKTRAKINIEGGTKDGNEAIYGDPLSGSPATGRPHLMKDGIAVSPSQSSSSCGDTSQGAQGVFPDTRSRPPNPAAPQRSVCDRYLRALSRNNATVRCRVQKFNEELARQRGETEALITQADARSEEETFSNQDDRNEGLDRSLALPSEIVANGGFEHDIDGCGRRSGRAGRANVTTLVNLSMATITSGNSELRSPPLWTPSSATNAWAVPSPRRRGSDGGHIGGDDINTGVPGPPSAIYRVSPRERVDPSHPRIDLQPYRQGAAKELARRQKQQPPRQKQAHNHLVKGVGNGAADLSSEMDGGTGNDGDNTFDGVKRNGQGEDGDRARRVAALLVRTLSDSKDGVPTSRSTISARREAGKYSNGDDQMRVSRRNSNEHRHSHRRNRAVDGGGPSSSPASHRRNRAVVDDGGSRGISSSPSLRSPSSRHALRFDPPSIRNGYTGLTTEQIDTVLLRVDESTPGAASCWKSPPRVGRSPFPMNHTSGPQPNIWIGAKERERQRRRQQNKEGAGVNPPVWLMTGLEEVSSAGVRDGAREEGRGGGAEAAARTTRTRTTKKQMHEVIRAPPSARMPPSSRKNVWDTDQLKWVSPRDRNRPQQAPTATTSSSSPPSKFFATTTSSVLSPRLASRIADRGRPPPPSMDPAGRGEGEFPASVEHSRRPARGYERLDADMYDSFLMSSKVGGKIRNKA